MNSKMLKCFSCFSSAEESSRYATEGKCQVKLIGKTESCRSFGIVDFIGLYVKANLISKEKARNKTKFYIELQQEGLVLEGRDLLRIIPIDKVTIIEGIADNTFILIVKEDDKSFHLETYKSPDKNEMSKIFNFFQSFESKAFVDFTGPLYYIAKEDLANEPSIAAAAVDGTSLSSFPSFPDLSSHSLASLVEFKEINDITMDATIKEKNKEAAAEAELKIISCLDALIDDIENLIGKKNPESEANDASSTPTPQDDPNSQSSDILPPSEDVTMMDEFSDNTETIDDSTVATSLNDDDTEATNDSTVATSLIDGDTEATNDSTVATSLNDDDTEATNDSTIATSLIDDDTEATNDSTIATSLIDDDTEATNDSTVATSLIDDDTEATNDSTVATSLIDEDTEATNDSIVATSLNDDDTEAINDSTVATSLIDDDTEATNDSTVATSLIDEDTEATNDSTVATSLIDDDTEATNDSTIATSLIDDDTKATNDSTVATSLIDDDTKATNDSTVAIRSLIDASKEVESASPADEEANALPQSNDVKEDFDASSTSVSQVEINDKMNSGGNIANDKDDSGSVEGVESEM